MATTGSVSTLLLVMIGMCVASNSSSSAKPFACHKEGRFSDPQDCSAFFTCKRDDAGGFRRSRGSCNGNAFLDAKQVCVAPAKVPHCKPSTRTSRQMTADPQYNHMCDVDEFKCVDCKTVINCVDGKAYQAETCGKSFSCQEKDFFGGGTCYQIEKDESECKCNEGNVFKSDPYNADGFIFCHRASGDPSVYKCPEGSSFNTSVTACVNKDGIPSCKETGVFANQKNCNQYYTCIQTSGEMVQKVFNCPEGQMYNENTKECSDPCGWPKASFSCTKEGRFSDPKNCNNFITCIKGNNEQEFVQTSRRCPINYIWNPSANKGTGHCVSPSTYECKPVMENICQRPETCSGPVTSTTSKPEEPSTDAPVTEAPGPNVPAVPTIEARDSYDGPQIFENAPEGFEGVDDTIMQLL